MLTHCRSMTSGKCHKKDSPQAVAAGKIRAAEFRTLKAAHPGSRRNSKRGKRKTNKNRMEKKIVADVLKAQEEDAATDDAVDNATADTVGTPPNACVPSVPQVAVQFPGGYAPMFGGDASVSGLTIVPPHMKNYRPMQVYQDGWYNPCPAGYALPRIRCSDLSSLCQCGLGGLHNLGFVGMVLLQYVHG